MRDFEIRCRFAACIFLIASCLIVPATSGAEPKTFRHLLTLPLDYDPAAKRSLYGEGCPLGVAFSPDGKTLAAGFNEKGVVLFDLPSGQVSATINRPNQSFLGVAFSSDGKVLGCGGRGVMLWDVANGRRLSSKLPTSSNLKEEWLRGVSIAPNGRLVAVQTLSIEDATEFKEVYQVWDLATGQSIGKFDPFAGTEPTIDKGPSRVIPAASPPMVRPWSMDSGERARDRQERLNSEAPRR